LNSNIYIALMHHPVYNKSGEVVTTAITNLDIHDIARTAKTYGLAGYYIVNPMAAQRELASRILSHWVHGFGAEYNPNRGEALGLVSVVGDLGEAVRELTARHGALPKVVATGARGRAGAASYGEMRDVLSAGGPYIIAFGTGWGLTEEFMAGADIVLMPVEGIGGYNHLPVRGAVAIILDRLLGDRA